MKTAPGLLKIADVAQQRSFKENRMFTIDVRLSLNEAISIMRAVAAKELTEPDPEKRDDLELIRLKFYDRIYHGQPETIRIDLGCVTHQSKGERQHAATVQAFRRLAA